MTKKLLIVVDMQNDFITGALANPQAEAIVNGIVKLVENFDGEVLLTRDTHGTNYMETQEGKLLPVPHCIEGTDGWQVQKDIDNAACNRYAHYHDKPTFGHVAIADRIKCFMEDGVEEITLVGTCTDICVVSNAMILKAEFPETKVKVIGDLCAGLSLEKHNAALEVMKSCQIEVL